MLMRANIQRRRTKKEIEEVKAKKLKDDAELQLLRVQNENIIQQNQILQNSLEESKNLRQALIDRGLAVQNNNGIFSLKWWI